MSFKEIFEIPSWPNKKGNASLHCTALHILFTSLSCPAIHWRFIILFTVSSYNAYYSMPCNPIKRLFQKKLLVHKFCISSLSIVFCALHYFISNLITPAHLSAFQGHKAAGNISPSFEHCFCPFEKWHYTSALNFTFKHNKTGLFN